MHKCLEQGLTLKIFDTSALSLQFKEEAKMIGCNFEKNKDYMYLRILVLLVGQRTCAPSVKIREDTMESCALFSSLPN